MRYEVDTGALATMIGVAPHVIRNWAARGLIQPVRTDGNRTIYDAEAAAKVAARLGHLPELREPADGTCCHPHCPAAPWADAPVPLCMKHTMAVWVSVNDALQQYVDSIPPPAEPHEPDPVVYFIQVGDRIKIGTTTGLRGRLDPIRSLSGHEPQVLLAVPGGRAEERQVHALFGEDRVRGEWFKPSERLLQFIAERRDLDVRHIHGPHYLPA